MIQTQGAEQLLIGQRPDQVWEPAVLFAVVRVQAEAAVLRRLVPLGHRTPEIRETCYRGNHFMD
ncbi:MAG TPA: hypothetical protein VGE15_04520, partial [Sphingobacteriaceae bacterium]